MKIVEGIGVVWIYPHVNPEGEPGPGEEYIVIYQNKTIQLVRPNMVRMDARATQALGEALLCASEIAKTGQKER